MMKSLYISVIIVTYNHGKYLDEAIKSVLQQSYQNYEIIVVDDGSTDDTQQIIDKYGGRIRYHYQVNQGEAAARNAGIRQATYDLIAFLDADDYWDPLKLEKQVGAFATYGDHLDVLVTNALWFSGEEIVKPDYFATMKTFFRQKTRYLADAQLTVFQESVFPVFIEENFVNMSSVLLRKECFLGGGFFDESLKRCTDRDLWLRVSRRYRFGYLDEILTRSRSHSLGMGPSSELNHVCSLRVFDKLLDQLESCHEAYRIPIQRQILNRILILAYFYYYASRYSEASRYFRLAITSHPLEVRTLLMYLVTCLPAPLIDQLRSVKKQGLGR